MDSEAAEMDDLRPLLLFFDCEAARGNVFRDDIIEIAVKCQPDLHSTAEFDSLIHTSQRICSFGQENGLTARALKGQPKFPEVLDRLLVWCDGVVEQVNRQTNYKHYPGRHRAMVDVQLLIKIFYETPLHQFLSTLPIFSTEEWKVFYETKKEIMRDKREFGDKLWFLHEVHQKFVIRSLVKHGLNYEGLKDFYQQCRSVQHFKQEMRELMDTHVKSFSIKRIAEHFSRENLPQLGTIPKTQVTTTLVPREGRSTIFDNDEGHTEHRNTGMSFSKIKKELEKSTGSVRGRGARRKHAFVDRSQAEEGRRFEGSCKDSHQGRRRSFKEKTSEKVDKKNKAHSRPGQKYTTSTSQHETKRSPEDKGERSSTWPPVFTYAQVLTEGKSQREGGGKGKSAPKDSTGKESKTKSVHKTQKPVRQYKSEHDTRYGTEEQAVGFKTKDNRKEDFCTPHPNEAEHSGNRKSAPKDSTGKESKTKSVHKIQKEVVQQYKSEHDMKNGTEEQAVGFKTKDNRKEDICKSHLNEVDRQHAGNRRRQNHWPDLFKQRPKRENQRHQNERKDLRDSEESRAKGSPSSLEEKGQNQCPDHFKQRPKRENQHHQNERKELRDSEESIAKGSPSSLEVKCRCGLQEKLPRSNFRKQNTNQRPRKQKNFAEKKCFCGLPHVEEDIPKSNKSSQVASSGKISEDSARGHLRSRPSSAKYGVLSTQDGRKKRDGPKDERKTDKPKKDAQEEGLDVSIEELLPYKNDAYKYLFTPVTNMDSSTAEEYDKLIVMYNQEYFQQKKGD
ncbi:PREDICTED: uncharacterized protein LOC109466634 [Branchiostoma belcheri]|uniref:Uncharacterized protein LOC109466634 n=1 Tax=Branchiostoma belcheri TaxID=7741 RepID=A0A6P4Y642_BRABE|nr:PREDICTED: uncharacterized protein LOC109466634 [Branchiostoma belcheri]